MRPCRRLQAIETLRNLLAMLLKLPGPGRLLVIATLLGWAGVTAVALLRGWSEVFASMGALLLCLGFAVFLTERYRATELRRLWDNQVEVQLRFIWRYVRRLRPGHQHYGPPQHSLDEMERILEESFEDLMAAKSAERGLETYRIEMALSIVGTLQWGFGGLLMGLFHG